MTDRKAPPDVREHCLRCGEEVVPDVLRCRHCGNPVSRKDSIKSETVKEKSFLGVKLTIK